MENPRWSVGHLARGVVILAATLLSAGCSYDGAWDAIRGLQGPFTPPDDTPWLDTSLEHRQYLVFDNRASADDLVDFPVLVTLTPDRVDYGQMRSLGQDLRFTDADGTTLLDHEINTWDSGGTSTIWVRVPRIDGESRRDNIWLYYGDAAATSLENAEGVWNIGFKGVWHLGDLTDATANANDAINPTTSGTTLVPGKIGNGRDFNGSTSFIDLGNKPSLQIQGQLTLEAWAYRRTVGYQCVIAKYDYQEVARSYMLGFDYRSPPYPPNGPCAVISDTGAYYAAGHVEYSSTSALNQWMHVAAVFGSNHLRLYVNGVRVDQAYPGFTTLLNNLEPVIIGACDNGNYFWFDGVLDEVRISDIARSESWINAQYLSMTDRLIEYGPRQAE